MQYNERLDAELKALEGDMIETLQRWIRVPSVRAERSADNAPFGENVRRALDTAMADLKRLGMEPRDVDGYCCDTEIGQGDEVIAVLSHLDDLGVKTRILFLDASNEVLIKRYESVRRPHPLQQGNRLIDGILEERDLLKNLKEHADIVIDTSALSIHQLSTKLYEGLLGSGPTTVSVHIFSFGFKYGIPIDADFVADVRFLPNPFWVPELRSLTGKDKPVSDYVLSSEGAEEFLDAYEKAIAIAIEGYAQEDKHYVTIAFGCTGGQHRSVAMSEALAKRLRARGLTVSVSARELDKRSAD